MHHTYLGKHNELDFFCSQIHFIAARRENVVLSQEREEKKEDSRRRQIFIPLLLVGSRQFRGTAPQNCAHCFRPSQMADTGHSGVTQAHRHLKEKPGPPSLEQLC